MNNRQLADVIRPRSFDEIAGQEHLFGERGVIRRMIEGGRITNMIFFGPPGTGKTTVANIIAKKTGKTFKSVDSAILRIRKKILSAYQK